MSALNPDSEPRQITAPQRVRLKFLDANGSRITKWGVWGSAWEATDWALSQGAQSASAIVLKEP